MVKIGLDISWSKNAVEIPNQYWQLGARSGQCWPYVGIEKVAAKSTIIGGWKMEMNEGHISNLEMLEVTWCQVCCHSL